MAFYNLAIAQSDTLDRYWYAFSQKLDISKYEGQKFVLEAAIRTELADSAATCRIWARIDKEKGYGFFDNMDDRPVRSNKWETYTISGVVDSSAKDLVFGGLCFYNGKFYYDNFNLKIQLSKKKWLNLPISNNDFENDLEGNWTSGIGNKKPVIRGFTNELVGAMPYAGKQSLMVKGEHVKNYGANDKAGHFYSINGASIYCKTYGTGKPLLLLHGNGQSIAAMDDQIDFFKDKYRVIIPDCRGRGRSKDSKDELTYRIQADDMRQLLDSLQVDSADIIGWSDGGIIGLIMAIDYPDKVHTLISSSANILQDTTVFTKEDLDDMVKIMNDTTASVFTRKLIGMMVKYPNIQYSQLEKIKCRVLFVSGDKDEIKLEHTLKMFQSVKKGQLFVVPATSHYVLSENPAVFNAAALTFLQLNK